MKTTQPTWEELISDIDAWLDFAPNGTDTNRDLLGLMWSETGATTERDFNQEYEEEKAYAIWLDKVNN